jgi:hypothetical protein
MEVLKKENDRNSSMPGAKKKLTDEELRQIAIHSQKSMGASYLNEIDGAIIGTAFAQFVLEGKIDPTLKNYVTKTVHREMLPILTRGALPAPYSLFKLSTGFPLAALIA